VDYIYSTLLILFRAWYLLFEVRIFSGGMLPGIDPANQHWSSCCMALSGILFPVSFACLYCGLKIGLPGFPTVVLGLLVSGIPVF
jgi:hypothetical protein